jgi:hypothetical protein
MYFPRNWEFGLALSKLQNFGGGFETHKPTPRYATAPTYKLITVFRLTVEVVREESKP